MTATSAPPRGPNAVLQPARQQRPRRAPRPSLLVLGCLALAGLSLLVPAALAYDPWSWLTWGREITRLDLHTTGGPAWKPLPALIDAPLSLAGSAAPTLWLVVARAGAFFAVAIAARLAFRLSPGRPFVRASAGAVAALGVLSCVDYLAYLTARGMSEPLLVAAVLYALDRHLAGRPHVALVCGLVAALVRPEVWPLLALYAVWLVWTRQVAFGLVVAAGALVLAAWLVPDLLATGNALRSFHRASVPDPGSPALTSDPGLEVLRRAWTTPLPPIRVLFVVGAAAALLGPPPPRQRSVRRMALAGALGWGGLVAGMAQFGASAGDARYLLPAVALGCVLAGVGWGQLADVIEAVAARAGGSPLRLAARVLAAAGAVVVAALVLAAPLGEVAPTLDRLRIQADTQAELPLAVRLAGGARRVVRCGRPVTGPYELPALAWALDVRLSYVRITQASVGNSWRRLRPKPPGAVIRIVTRGSPRTETSFAFIARTRHWVVRATCDDNWTPPAFRQPRRV